MRQLGFGEAVAAGVYALDEHWNGSGRPTSMAGEAIPLDARIALLAQVVDVFHAVGGPRSAQGRGAPPRRHLVRSRRGGGVPRGRAGRRILGRPGDEGLGERVAALEPVARVVTVDEDRLDVIAAAFADIVDAKSPFTAGHSRRVTPLRRRDRRPSWG